MFSGWARDTVSAVRSFFATCLAAVLFCVVAARSAEAHVKWFCAYDVAGQPRGLENVLCLDFELLLGVAIFWLFAGCLIEPTSLGDATIRVMDRVTEGLRLRTELMIRAVCAFFFISIWAVGGILLTPELKTTSPFVGALQLAIAAGMLSRRTLPLSAAGMVVLFGIGVRDYGVFHLADYPIFLGVAAYLALVGLNKDLFGIRPIDVMRYAAAVTLMWASVEKWAYPEWSFPLLIEHSAMTLGFDNEFYMRAAGMVEFTLAFALIWTPLIRRCAATVLTGMFISACFEFGKIDTIGHSAIIAVLLAIVADNKVLSRDRRAPWLAPVALCAALSVTLFVYYFGHAAIFKTSVL
ncbi:hypothetical protein AB7M47_000178 [Bradyrhizobium elkanii]|jgi:hypothetical protein